MGESSKFPKSWTFEIQTLKQTVYLQNNSNFTLKWSVVLTHTEIDQRSYYSLLNSAFWGWLSMESQPQNPEFRNNPENFHPWKSTHMLAHLVVTYSFCSFSFFLSSTWSSLEQRDIIIRFYHIHLQTSSPTFTQSGHRFSHFHKKTTKGYMHYGAFFPPMRLKY